MARRLKMVETGHRCPRVGAAGRRGEGPKALRTVEEMGHETPKTGDIVAATGVLLKETRGTDGGRSLYGRGKVRKTLTLPETSGTKGRAEMSGVGEAKKSGLAGPAVTLIGAMATAALLKPRTPPKVHSRIPSRHPRAPAAVADAPSTMVARDTTEPGLQPRTRNHRRLMPSHRVRTAPPTPRGRGRTLGGTGALRRNPAKDRAKSRTARYLATAQAWTAHEWAGLPTSSVLGVDHRRACERAELICIQGRLPLFRLCNLRIGAVFPFLNRKQVAGDGGVRRLCRSKEYLFCIPRRPLHYSSVTYDLHCT